MDRPKLTDGIILDMMYDSCPSELCDSQCMYATSSYDCADDCSKIQLKEYKKEIRQQGRADVIEIVIKALSSIKKAKIEIEGNAVEVTNYFNALAELEKVVKESEAENDNQRDM